MVIDSEAAYRALRGRDARFDGEFFAAVSSTGIYCRPSCPAKTPLRRNVNFYPSAAAAQRSGFRACKRCRPDAAPGSAAWNSRADLAGRAFRLIADGVIDRHGVTGLAQQLGYSERQIGRTLIAELGAPAISLARAQRAQTARTLLERTDMPASDVAFAAGFGSIRQFNDTIQAIFASNPSELRDRAPRPATDQPRGNAARATITLRLAYRRPMQLSRSLDFLGARMVAGLEDHDEDGYRRTLRLPHGSALVQLSDPGAGAAFVLAHLQLTDHRDLAAAVARLRRYLDLDADPVAIDETFTEQTLTRGLVLARPGLRSIGSVDGFEILLRAIIGQQVSVRAARTVLARLVREHGESCFEADGATVGWRLFPSPDVIAEVDPAQLPMPSARARAVVAAAHAVATGELDLSAGADRMAARRRLMTIAGIGSWTADYVMLRAMSDPDVFLAGDLVIKRRLAALGPVCIDQLAPWRSYFNHHLWALTEQSLSPSKEKTL